MINEEGLRDWFGKSKSKDGKSGWVNVVTGGTCASDEPGEGTPKCVSSAKRASMTKAERLSASRRKKAADPNQQSKSGAAKPTYVKTDSKKKMKEEAFTEEKDTKGKGSGKKDACYHKVKASASVWPSAYASGRLVQCRKKGAANYGKSKKNEEWLALPEMSDYQIQALENAGVTVEVVAEMAPAVYDTGKANIRNANQRAQKKAGKIALAVEDSDPCWDSHKQVGMKKKGGRMVPNCVPKEEVEEQISERSRVFSALEALKGGQEDEEQLGEVIATATKVLAGKEVDEGLISGIETSKKIRKDLEKRKKTNEEVEVPEVELIYERVKMPSKMGNIYLVEFTWLGRFLMMKIFFPTVGKPTRQQVQITMNKIYPGCKVLRYEMAPQQPQEPIVMAPSDQYRFVDKDQTNMYGEDKDWIQNATKDMRTDKPCTGDKYGSDTCPPGSKRYNLAKTFRKMAKDRKAKK